mmetsp:Transcript_8589/g.20996  ORF Transcript_8589/g.20996 Transcript_8589/m.20996 type:complete len:202 (-) Transcript_8589:2-607(-)
MQLPARRISSPGSQRPDTAGVREGQSMAPVLLIPQTQARERRGTLANARGGCDSSRVQPRLEHIAIILKELLFDERAAHVKVRALDQVVKAPGGYATGAQGAEVAPCVAVTPGALGKFLEALAAGAAQTQTGGDACGRVEPVCIPLAKAGAHLVELGDLLVVPKCVVLRGAPGRLIQAATSLVNQLCRMLWRTQGQGCRAR